MDGNTLSGYFTGTDVTNTDMWGMTFPLTVTFAISPRWSVSAGPYFSTYFHQDFSGKVYDNKDVIDYLIIDEAQDFNVSDYKQRIVPKAGVSLSLFGDSAQQMNSQGSNIEDIATALDYDRLSLDYNYRLPKSIAKVAQQIQNTGVDLMTNNRKDGGDSDYPNYPKPVIAKYNNREAELLGILNKIQMEDLDDVAILVPTEADVMGNVDTD